MKIILFIYQIQEVHALETLSKMRVRYLFIFGNRFTKPLFDEDEQLFLDMLKMDMIVNKDYPNVECQIFDFLFVVSKNEVYKNLRRHSASLAFILTIFLPALLFFFNISCTPRRTILESSQQVYGMLIFDLDCLAIVLGWLLIQVSINVFNLIVN